MNTNNTPTPETDDNDTQAELAAWELLAEARRERDELRRWTSVNGVLELQRERDRALEKVENQRARIVYLEGAISHATGTPLTKAKDEIKQLNRDLDEAREELAEWKQRCLDMRSQRDRARFERDELREAIRETIMENLHLADGDICTLKRLKDAIGFDLDSQNKTSPSVGANE